jgi:uncharacterized protein involved in exopolysaccharide biosynthesis
LGQEVVTTASHPPRVLRADHWEGWRQESAYRLLHVIFKRKGILLTVFVAFVVAAGVAVTMQPPVRSATVKLLLKPDRVSVQISDITPQSNKGPYSPQIMQSELELIESRDVLVKVARTLLSPAGPGAAEIPAAEIERKVSELAANTVPVALRDTSVIEITYLSTTAQEAEETLGLIVAEYMNHHATAYGGSGQLLSFYEQEGKRSEDEMAAAEDALRSWQKANNVVSVDQQLTGLLDVRSRQARQLQEIEASAKVASEQNPLLARLRGDRIASEVELDEILQRYTDDDRRTREKRAQIALLEKEIRTIEKSLASSLVAQQNEVRQQVRESTTALERLQARKLEGERFTRAVDMSRSSYLLYAKKLEDARISSKLDEKELSNIAVIERPHATHFTDGPRRMGIFLLSAIVGLVLGITMAFALEFFNKSLRTREDVEAHLGLPVLAMIADLQQQPLPGGRAV